jgi:ABC-type transport system substrate-binding protein
MEQLRHDSADLIGARLKDVGIQVVPNVVSPDDLFADAGSATAATPCTLSRSNFDLAEISRTSPVDPLDSFFAYHSSQVAPNGTNVAGVDDPDIDAALSIVESSVDFGVIRQAMADFQAAYRAQTAEIPLVFRAQVQLVAPRLQNVFPGPYANGITWNAVDWFIKR